MKVTNDKDLYVMFMEYRR